VVLSSTCSSGTSSGARAKGLSHSIVVWKHAAKNAAPPVVTVFGLQVARVIGGTIVIESIFAISGIGSLAYKAVLARDVPVIQGIALVSAFVVLFVNFLVDFSYVALTPRSRR
jgi:peptide/nickel transport system permease protein